MKIPVDKEDDQIALKNRDVANGNGSTDLTDKDTELEKSATITENDVVDVTLESNELPPLKKPKCVVSESCSIEAEDAGLNLIFHFFSSSFFLDC